MAEEKTDVEFDNIMKAVETLEACAVEHEANQKTPNPQPCWGNRTYLAAMAIDRLGLSVDDLGAIARILLDMEYDEDEPPVGEESADSDDILDAKEIGVSHD